MLGFKRLLASLAVLSVLFWLGTTSALAAGNPDRQPLPSPPDVIGPFCGTAIGDIVAHVAVQREYIKTLSSSKGLRVMLWFQASFMEIAAARLTNPRAMTNRPSAPRKCIGRVR